MEYLVGSLVTLITVAVANRLISKQLRSSKQKMSIEYSQSHIYSLVSNILYGRPKIEQSATQARKYQQDQYIRIVVSEEKAYWIKDNTFYVADLVNGAVDKESTKEVDTMAMNDVELKKMIYIVEALKEGETDDYWRPGKP